jgi:hypothetical protein
MTDEELAEELDVTIEHVCKLTPERRSLYEHMLSTVDAIERGERPSGVILTYERKRR